MSCVFHFGFLLISSFLLQRSSTGRCPRYSNQLHEQFTDALCPKLSREENTSYCYYKGLTMCFQRINCSTNCGYGNRAEGMGQRGKVQLTSVRTTHAGLRTPSRLGGPSNPGSELVGACAGNPAQPGLAAGVAGIGGYRLVARTRRTPEASQTFSGLRYPLTIGPL